MKTPQTITGRFPTKDRDQILERCRPYTPALPVVEFDFAPIEKKILEYYANVTAAEGDH